jgi:hypothetical protein
MEEYYKKIKDKEKNKDMEELIIFWICIIGFSLILSFFIN